jgi:TonB-dependent SusC/RagA subfamily outer membrane receptor
MLMLLMSILQINILGIFGAQAKSVENTRLNMKVEKATIVQVFKEIEKQTQFHFSYNDAYLNEQVKVTLNVQNKRLSEVLNFLTKEVNLQFKQVRGNIHVLNTANTDRNYNPNVQSNAILEDIIVSGAVLHVSGRVTSREDNQPVAGATIRIKGTNKGTVADAQGNYKIEVDDANAVIEISSVGFLKQEIRVGGRSTINVELTADIAKLDEVVVVGYGTQKVKDLTGSVGIVKMEDAKKTASYDVAKMLQGQVAGVTVHGSGEPGGFVSIKIRGISSFNNNSPLFVIDGVPVDAPFDFSPDDIESVQVLKDASAGAIYGARAATGVVIITTKKGKAGL